MLLYISPIKIIKLLTCANLCRLLVWYCNTRVFLDSLLFSNYFRHYPKFLGFGLLPYVALNAHPNDKTFNFCQQCGFRRENFVGTAKQVKINLNATDARLEALASRKKNKPYEKQRSSLAVEFDNFLFFPSLHLKPLCPHRPLMLLGF